MVLGALCALIGILAVINPHGCIEAVVIVIGVAAIIDGITSLSTLKTLGLSSQYTWIIIVKSVLGIVVGVLAVVLPFAMFDTLQNIVRVFLYIQAVFLLLSALAEFAIVFANGSSARGILREAIVSLCVAILLFLLPRNFGVYIVRIVGVLLFCAGIVLAVIEWRGRAIEVEAEEISEEDADDEGTAGGTESADANSGAASTDRTEE